MVHGQFSLLRSVAKRQPYTQKAIQGVIPGNNLPSGSDASIVVQRQGVKQESPQKLHFTASTG